MLMVVLRDVYRQNGRNDWQIYTVLNCCLNISKPDSRLNLVAFLQCLAYIQLNQQNTSPTQLQAIGPASQENICFLWPIKGNL
jgi:hypothetical protein